MMMLMLMMMSIMITGEGWNSLASVAIPIATTSETVNTNSSPASPRATVAFDKPHERAIGKPVTSRLFSQLTTNLRIP
jgi:hypothetical protein